VKDTLPLQSDDFGAAQMDQRWIDFTPRDFVSFTGGGNGYSGRLGGDDCRCFTSISFRISSIWGGQPI